MDKCIVCGNNEWKSYCKIENKYDVIGCKQCSFFKLDPLPTEKELNEFYSGLYRKKYSSQDEVNLDVIGYEQKRANRVINIVKKHFKKEYRNILDIGCSSGTLLKNLGSLSDQPNLYGIEMNDNYRKYIKSEKIAQEENITNDDIENYFIGRENKFDFISIVHVLEHLRNPQKALESIYTLLDKNGLLYIEVPNLKTPYGDLRKNYFIMYHLYYFSDVTLQLLLEKIGFSILEKKQIANTSICFVCSKVGPQTTSLNSTEYNNVIKKLKNYELFFPILSLKKYPIKLLQSMGIQKLLGKK